MSDRPDLRPPLPLTVFGGFLGAGKTTLINALITELADRRLAVVVNDFGSIDVDGRLIAAVHDDVVTLTNGCICCTMRDGVGTTVLRLAERAEPPEHVLIEASGASEPGALAEVFIELQRAGFVRVDGLVTAIDADGFAPDDPDVGRLTRAQVAQGDLLVLTKLDLVDTTRADEVRSRLRVLNPHARVVDAADCTPNVLLGLRDADVFDSARPQRLTPVPASTQFRTGHLRIDEPVSFRPLFDALKALPIPVFRAKGWLNLAERPGDKIVVHVVGRRIHVRTEGQWGDTPDDIPRTELVLIGAARGWDPATVTAELTAAARE